MTKFKLLSDLHLEFYDKRIPGGLIKQHKPWVPEPRDDDKDTVLLLAGDIHVGKKGEEWINRMCKRFKEVIYIAGNHEFYGNEYYEVLDHWNNKNQEGNFTFLNDDTCIVDDVRIFGATLWTNVTDAFNVWNGKKMMTDYKVIKFNHMRNGQLRKLNVQDTNNFHLETIQKLQQWLQIPWKGKTIVMTHHLPHPLCTHPKWEGNNLNDFFVTNLDNIIERFDIDYWVHGHTHDNVDVKVHGTRILCNPMGYHGIQLNQDFNGDCTFEC
jgi:UDP-2,3-diacylglucosamine pyrophosphatase LpxH